MKRYVRAIDGLRAIAVVAVLAFHAFPHALPGGFIGVDIFFVVSGYIITRTSFDDLELREVSLGQFYAKRVRRLAPAYLVVLLLTAIGAFLLLSPPQLRNFSVSLGAQPLYGQNITFWLDGDYFDKALTKPLLHTWSLAVEEQFYLGYGLLVLLARRNRRLTVPLLGLAGIASYLLAYKVGAVSPKTAFYWLPTRIWEFALGVLLARSTRQPSAAQATVSRAVGLLLVAASILLFDETARFPGSQSLAACIGTALVLWSLTPTAPQATFLELPPMTYLGRTSYSLYLWHWPLIALASTRLGRPLAATEALAALALTIVLSHLSSQFLEDPIRRGKWFPRDRALIGGVAAVGLATFAAAFALFRTFGAVDRFPPTLASLYRAQQERSPYRCSLLTRLRYFSSELCPVNDIKGPGGILVLGDSHADQLDEAIASLGSKQGLSVYLTSRNCSLDVLGAGDGRGHGRCSGAVMDRLLRDIERQGIRYVFAISYMKEDVSAAALERGVDRLLSGRVTRLFITQVVPTGDYFDPAAHIAALEGGRKPPEPVRLRQHEERTRPQRQILEGLHANHERVTILDPAPRICATGTCLFEWEGRPLYFDDNHLSPTGASLVAPMFADAILELARAELAHQSNGSHAPAVQ